jgi:hypothetical protein
MSPIFLKMKTTQTALEIGVTPKALLKRVTLTYLRRIGLERKRLGS